MSYTQETAQTWGLCFFGCCVVGREGGGWEGWEVYGACVSLGGSVLDEGRVGVAKAYVSFGTRTHRTCLVPTEDRGGEKGGGGEGEEEGGEDCC